MLPPLLGWSPSDVTAAINYIISIKHAYARDARGAKGYVTNLYDRVTVFKTQLELLRTYLESQNTRYFVLDLNKDIGVISPTLEDSIKITLTACDEFFKPNADFTNPEKQTSRLKQLRGAFRHVHGGQGWAIELGNRLSAHELHIQTFMQYSKASVDNIRWQALQTNVQQISEEQQIVIREIRELRELQQLRSRSPAPGSRMLHNRSQSMPTEDLSQPSMSSEGSQTDTSYIVDHLHDLEIQEAVYRAVQQRRGSQTPGLQDCQDSLKVAIERIEQYLKRQENQHLQGASQDDTSRENTGSPFIRNWSMVDQDPTQSLTSRKHSDRFDSAIDVTPHSPIAPRSARSSHTDIISGSSSIDTRIEAIAEFETVGRATLVFNRKNDPRNNRFEDPCDVQIMSVGSTYRRIIFRWLQSKPLDTMPSIDISDGMPCATPIITKWRISREGQIIYSFQLVSDTATRIPDGMTNVVCTFAFKAWPVRPIEPVVFEFLTSAYKRIILQCIVVNKIKCTTNKGYPSKGNLSPPENQILSLWVNPPPDGEPPSTRKNDYYLIHRDMSKKPTIGIVIPLSRLKSWNLYPKELRLSFELKTEFRNTHGWHQIHFFFAANLHRKSGKLCEDLSSFVNRFANMVRSNDSIWSAQTM